mgnify:CR=1 FL=1
MIFLLYRPEQERTRSVVFDIMVDTDLNAVDTYTLVYCAYR